MPPLSTFDSQECQKRLVVDGVASALMGLVGVELTAGASANLNERAGELLNISLVLTAGTELAHFRWLTGPGKESSQKRF